MLALYPLLVETVIEFQRSSIKVQKQQGSKEKETPNTNTTVVALGYKVKYSESDDFFYCLCEK